MLHSGALWWWSHWQRPRWDVRADAILVSCNAEAGALAGIDSRPPRCSR
jgi:hypothetical protein